MEKHSILTNNNHGFRSGYSCETQLLTTMHDIMKSHDAGRQVDVAILDFSKAFDTVPHGRLLSKLHHYGVRGPVHQWITCFLTQRSMRVVLEGAESEEVTVMSGVLQGTVLGPLLFLCHINDLPQSVKSTVRLFADDCLLYREIRTFQDHLTLQEDLRQLEQWAHKWGMQFNAKKCYILSSKPTSNFFFTLDGTILKHVDKSPYLGVQILSDLKWSPHVTTTSNRASSTLGFLRRNLRNCPQTCGRTAYIALVRSTLEYAAVVWDPHLKQDIERLERVQHRAARFITKDYKSREPGFVTKMLKDLELTTLQERRRQHRLTTLFKISAGQIPALPPENFLTPAKQTRRRVKPTQFSDYSSNNVIERQAINNSKGLTIPHCRTELFRHSFFVKTAQEWNHLSEEVIGCTSAKAFSTAVGNLPPPPSSL
ncbi:hypothetical protein V1264_006874 [Littorina saxatilis]|uniref:Reverse transcriptase domain-containing protein n=1 Tax=Littorina saxatilis TaxID=31220 RepID=A0AAN9AY12_9CAEN